MREVCFRLKVFINIHIRVRSGSLRSIKFIWENSSWKNRPKLLWIVKLLDSWRVFLIILINWWTCAIRIEIWRGSRKCILRLSWNRWRQNLIYRKRNLQKKRKMVKQKRKWLFTLVIKIGTWFSILWLAWEKALQLWRMSNKLHLIISQNSMNFILVIKLF